MNWKFILASLLLFASALRADPSVTTVSFTELLVYGTDTFETSTGTLLSTAQYVYWDSEIPADIAGDIAADPTFSLSDPAAQSFIQSTAPEAALTDDLDFLSAQVSSTSPKLPNVFYTDASPTVYTGFFASYKSGDFSAAFPAFTVTSQEPELSIGVYSYSTGASDPSGNLIEGTCTFYTYEVDLVEQPVPEPSAPALVIGLAIIVLKRKVGERAV